MDSAIKTLLTVVFPGLAGFVIGCVVILPQLLLLGMSPSLTLFVGIVVTGLFASGVSAMLRQRYKDDGQSQPMMAAE